MTPPPPKNFEICIANGALWIDLYLQLRAEISPIFSKIFHSSPATYFSHSVGLFLYRCRDKGSPIIIGGVSAPPPPPKKGGSGPPPPPYTRPWLTSQTGLCVAAPINSNIKSILSIVSMYISMKYQHYVDIHHHRIYEFVGISNFMLFLNKQTFDAPSNAGVQCIYARNVDISLTKTCKQLTIITESWHSNTFL